MASALNIVSYNLHGLAQGASLLSDLCETFDTVFVSYVSLIIKTIFLVVI